MANEYNYIIRQLSAVPRSKLLSGKNTGHSSGSVIITGSSGGSGSSSGNSAGSDGHTHDNKSELDRILTSATDTYICVKHWNEVNENGSGYLTIQKASVGFADTAELAYVAEHAFKADESTEAEHALVADYAPEAGHADNADTWNQCADWLNQPVRTGDKVVFAGLTVRAEETTTVNTELTVESNPLLPEGDLDTTDLSEENFDTLTAISSAIGEIVVTSGSVTGGTIGSLDNVSEEADYAPDGSLLVMKDGEYIPSATLSENVAALMEKVFPFSISTLSGGGTYEKGSAQTVILSWSYDRTPDSQNLNGTTLAINVRTKEFPGVTSTTTYTLTATSGGMTASKSVSASFQLKKYYGVSAASTLSNAQILSLSQTWAARTQAVTTFDCTGGKYAYYVIPTSLKSGIQFWINGLRNTDWTEEVRGVTNGSGYTESYTIYRITEPQTGVLAIEVK